MVLLTQEFSKPAKQVVRPGAGVEAGAGTKEGTGGTPVVDDNKYLSGPAGQRGPLPLLHSEGGGGHSLQYGGN